MNRVQLIEVEESRLVLSGEVRSLGFATCVVLWLMAAWLFAGCRPGTDGARQTLSNLMKVQAETQALVDAGNRPIQEAIEARHPGKARADLDAYRAKRLRFDQALVAMRGVEMAGLPLLDAVDRGMKSRGDLDAWLAALLAAATAAEAAAAELGAVPPPPAAPAPSLAPAPSNARPPLDPTSGPLHAPNSYNTTTTTGSPTIPYNASTRTITKGWD